MASHPVNRRTVDLSAYPDMVVIYLGMRVNAWRGLLTLFGFGPKIQKAVADKPDGLLLHEDLIWSIFPFHLGMRQYWRDFDALERWARSEPHRQWWAHFVRDSGGNRLLARNALHARRHGSGLRRHAAGHRAAEVRTVGARTRRDVLGTLARGAGRGASGAVCTGPGT